MDILRMLLWQFSTPILWANLLAWPVSALLLRRWLEGFPEHINLGLLTFVAAGVLTLVIASSPSLHTRSSSRAPGQWRRCAMSSAFIAS